MDNVARMWFPSSCLRLERVLEETWLRSFWQARSCALTLDGGAPASDWMIDPPCFPPAAALQCGGGRRVVGVGNSPPPLEELDY